MSKTKADAVQDPSVTSKYKENMDRIKLLAPNIGNFGQQPKSNDLLNGSEIMNIVGLPPNPPPGLPGYIEVVKEQIREAQDENPTLTKEQAIQIVQSMANSGQFEAYKKPKSV